MTYKTVSTKSIIGKVYRDFKPSNSNWTYDAIEWIGEAIQAIGYHCGLETKTTDPCNPIKIKNHKGCYPCDFESLIGVVYNGRRLPIGADITKTGIIKINPNKDTRSIKANDSDILELTKLTERLSALQKLEQENPSDETEQLIVDTLKKINHEAAFLVGAPSDFSRLGADYYSINPDYIITSFEEGEIDLIYVALVVDEDGFPKVLDDYYYKEAIQWYIIRQMLMGGYKHPEFNWATANSLFELNRDRAANKQKMPSIDEMDRFANCWTRLNFNGNLSSHFFSGVEGTSIGNVNSSPIL